MPRPTRPVLFGRRASGSPLRWSWALSRLRSSPGYWVVTVGPDGRPHPRPVWGIWLDESFLFSTGSRAVDRIARQPAVSVHLPNAEEALIVEGTATRVNEVTQLQRFTTAYNRKYGWDLQVDDGEVMDSQGNRGAVLRVDPLIVYGWQADLSTATRWTFDRDD